MVLTEVELGESNAQVLILIAVVVGLVVISSALALNAGVQATIDTADGVSTTTPEAVALVEAVNEDIQRSIVASNRDPSIDITTGDIVTQQRRNYSAVSAYQRQLVDITVAEYIGGTRLYTGAEAELTNDTTGNWTVVENPDELTGGIEVNASSISNAAGPLRIETPTHDISITNGSGRTVEATVEGAGTTETYRSNRSHPYIDLGDGSFAGYQFEGYDQTETTRIAVHNGTAADGTIELVVTGYDSADPALTADPDATFGVVYTVSVQTERHTLTRDDIATHGPVRGDF